jgi:hypothetical protein
MKKTVLFWVCLLCAGVVRGDEGMWLLPLLNQRSAEMQALGLKLQDYDIYNPDSSSLKDAVILFDTH